MMVSVGGRTIIASWREKGKRLRARRAHLLLLAQQQGKARAAEAVSHGPEDGLGVRGPCWS